MGYNEPKGVPQLPIRRGVISINTSQTVDKTFPPIPSSAAVERLFSTALDILRQKRSSLKSENFELFLFLKKNNAVLNMQPDSRFKYACCYELAMFAINFCSKVLCTACDKRKGCREHIMC